MITSKKLRRLGAIFIIKKEGFNVGEYIVEKLETDKFDEWDKFTESSQQGSVFNKSWYLQNIYKNFDIHVVRDPNKKIVAGMIFGYHNKTKWIIFNRSLHSGILFIDFSSYKESKKNSLIIEWTYLLINSMPKVLFYYSNFHYSFDNWVPFLWKGYEQYTRYTYIIDNSLSIEQVFNNFSRSLRKEIGYAKKYTDGVLCEKENLDYKKDFYKLLKSVYDRQNKKAPMTFKRFCMYDDMLNEKKCRRIFFASHDGQIVSALYIVYDSDSAYLIMSGTLSEFRQYNHKSLLVYEAIKYFNEAGIKYFDFEGSIMKNVEIYNRKFGGKYQPYYVITKSNNIILDFLWWTRKKSRLKRLYVD